MISRLIKMVPPDHPCDPITWLNDINIDLVLEYFQLKFANTNIKPANCFTCLDSELTEELIFPGFACLTVEVTKATDQCQLDAQICTRRLVQFNLLIDRMIDILGIC